MASPEKNPCLYLSGPGKAHVGECPRPIIEDGHDVIVRIAFVGVCGSDVRVLLNLLFKTNSIR
jgi:D-xylulose reductase